ncbi:MAG: 4Fe-4S dicluster domain-containing protein, partial [Brevibacterium linens]
MSTPTIDGGALADGHWHDSAHGRKGFFTDTSICIGCKACEVA